MVARQATASAITSRNPMSGVMSNQQTFEHHHRPQFKVISLISLHSFRAGGAMALKLIGHSDTTIMKFGQWKSLTFLQYIHNQIAHISAGVSQSMSTELKFTNIAAIEAW
jgi:hypothetical protein